MFRNIRILISFLFIILILFLSLSYAQIPKENILIPNSYHRDYPWSDNIKIKKLSVTSSPPRGSIVINQPLPFNKIYKVIIWILSATLIVLLYSILVLVINIRKRDKAEKSLVRKTEDLKTILVNLKQGIAYLDKNDVIKYLNKQCADMFGFKYKDIVGKNIYGFHPTEKKEKIESLINEFKGGKQSLNIIELVKGRFIDNTFYRIQDSHGRYRGILMSAFDITDRKQAEEKIRISLKEKELLLQEIHHRVKNNMQVILSILELQSLTAKNREISDMISVCQDRIRSMALIHEKLYQAEDLVNIDFKEYTETLANTLINSYKKENQEISLQVDVQEMFFSLETVIPLGLIINELVSNSLKHGLQCRDRGKIEITIKNIDNDLIELKVRDNGVGLPDDFDIKNVQSLGLQIVTLLAEQKLHGKIIINREEGAEFQLLLKRAKYKERI